MVALVQKEIIIIIIIIPEILFNTEYIAFSVFPFIVRFFCCEYNSTTDLPDPTDNWVHKNNGQYRGEYQIELIYQ